MTTPSRRARTVAFAPALPLACGLALAPPSSAAAAPAPVSGFPTWDVTPRMHAIDPARFGALMSSGHSGMLRIALVGDSQETSPGGAGLIYVPNINWRLFEHYGHAGETGLMSNRSTAGSPPADWLAVSAFVFPSGLPSEFGPLHHMPNTVYKKHRAKGAGLQAYGMMGVLAHDGSKTADSELPVQPYFNTSHEVRAELFAWTQPVSGELSWQSLPAPEVYPNFFLPVTGSGVVDLDLAQPFTEVRSGLTAPLVFGGQPYMQIEVWGTSTDPTVFTELVGLRFVDATERRGAIAVSVAEGGAQTTNLVVKHPSSGPLFKAFGFDVALIHYGANDSSAQINAVQFQANTVGLIQWLRSAMGDPHFPVILACDLYATNLPAFQQAQTDQYAGALKELADGDPDLLSLNLRRIVFEDLGWGPDNTSYLSDGVHLNAYGQRALAKELVDELTSLETPPGGAADLNGDGIVDANDLGVMLAGWGTTGPGDLDGSGEVDAADLGLLLAAWSGD